MDPHRFSMAIPNIISAGIHRLFECEDNEEGVPNSVHIIHDCNMAWISMYTVYLRKGAVVHELCDRNDHHYQKSGTGVRGG